MARPPEYSPAAGHRGPSRPPVVLCPMMELLEQFRARYPFPLDDFQLEAIRAIEAGQSVIVSAPTGSGKTLVAEFAIHTALATGKRIAYTTPLKALSNQKFNDFTRAFGAETVGILTGDVKVNPPGRGAGGAGPAGRRRVAWARRPRPLVHAPGGGPRRPDRRARDARVAPRDLLHLQPRRLRARAGRRPRRGPRPPHRRAAGRRGPRD